MDAMSARTELILAATFAVTAFATAIRPTWPESLTGLDPDGGSGEAGLWVSDDLTAGVSNVNGLQANPVVCRLEVVRAAG